MEGTAQARLILAADKAEIIENLSRYHHAVDFKRWDALDALLADDAVASWPGMGAELGLGTDAPEGREAIKQWLRKAAGETITVHYMLNHVIDVDGDSARNRSMVAIAAQDGALSHLGYYDGTHRRTTEGWRVVSLRFTRSELFKRRGRAG